MPDPPSAPQALLLRAAIRGAGWIRERTFVLAPGAWYAAALLSLAGGAAGWLLGLPWLGAVLGCFGAVALLPSLAWVRARRRPVEQSVVVFLARFHDENPEHSTIATVHLHEVERRLRRNDLLGKHLDLRLLKAPVTERQARRLLRYTYAQAVISGSGLLVDAHVRWEGWMLLRWPQTTSSWGYDAASQSFVEDVIGHFSAVERSSMPSDTEFAARRMTMDLFSAEHARAIEGVLLIAVAAMGLGVADKALAQADEMRDALPLQALAVLEIGHAMSCLDRTDDPAQAARQLEAAGDAGVDHIYLWNSCGSLWTWAERVGADSSNRARVGEKAQRIAPNDFYANSTTGIAYMALEQPQEAVPHLERALEHVPLGVDPSLLIEAMIEALWKTGRREDAQALQLGRYGALPRRARRAVLRELGLTEAEYLAKAQAPPPPGGPTTYRCERGT